MHNFLNQELSMLSRKWFLLVLVVAAAVGTLVYGMTDESAKEEPGVAKEEPSDSGWNSFTTTPGRRMPIVVTSSSSTMVIVTVEIIGDKSKVEATIEMGAFGKANPEWKDMTDVPVDFKRPVDIVIGKGEGVLVWASAECTCRFRTQPALWVREPK
jgi:hypothetical protein